MANLANQFFKTTKNVYGTSPASIPAISSSATQGQFFAPAKPPKSRSDVHVCEYHTRRIDSAISGIHRPDSPEDTSPCTSFQAYAQSRIKLNMANRPHHKRNHSISSGRPVNDSAEWSTHLARPNRRPRPRQDPTDYNPLHLGPHITVSSADGTRLWPEPHDGNEMKNTAAAILFRTIEARRKQINNQISDGHLDLTIGAIDIEVQKKSVGARHNVHFVNRPEIQPQQAVFEGQDDNEGQVNKDVLRRVSTKIKKRVSGWWLKLL
jgi:hypothetical protein